MIQNSPTNNTIKAELLHGIARGEKALAEGRVATHAEAKKRLARWLKPSSK